MFKCRLAPTARPGHLLIATNPCPSRKLELRQIFSNIWLIPILPLPRPQVSSSLVYRFHTSHRLINTSDIMPPKKDTTPLIAVNFDAVKDKSVIITGEISGLSRKAAEQVLIDAGAKIEKSLNKKVQLVVLGENAGPSKLEKIDKMGIETVGWDGLMEEIKGDGVAVASGVCEVSDVAGEVSTHVQWDIESG